ncbi:hypothetical protein EVAR_47964_1 [Eumeta japonica]|uniref:THAP-type domain-containing protein n=1 Tax=Eumeta variegata TaxID=151549 RepID=A0A4C1XAS9_EUMVA|nr:hypothetical protein EVAR_47964_1 [Eumeta japonica]
MLPTYRYKRKYFDKLCVVERVVARRVGLSLKGPGGNMNFWPPQKPSIRVVSLRVGVVDSARAGWGPAGKRHLNYMTSPTLVARLLTMIFSSAASHTTKMTAIYDERALPFDYNAIYPTFFLESEAQKLALFGYIDDASLHFFHYPVADKVRCYQWIRNAQRYDFFNLTVAQLKNRVVCQYHFKDSMFMNDMKLKLKINAIPTENGPNCTADLIFGKGCEISFLDNLPIESENSCFTVPYSRRTDLSLRYIDFLTNGVTTDLDIENLSAKEITTNEVKKKDEKISIDIVPSLFQENQNIASKIEENSIQALPKKETKQTSVTHFDENHITSNEIDSVSSKITTPGNIIKEEKTECPTFDTKYNTVSNDKQKVSSGLELPDQTVERNQSRENEGVNASLVMLPEQLIFPTDKNNSLLQLNDITDVIQQTSASSSYPQYFENNQPFDLPQDKIIYDNNKETELEITLFNEALQNEFKTINEQPDTKNSKRIIEIISEEKVSGPVPIVGGKILNVTPSFVLLPPKKTKSKILTRGSSVTTVPQLNVTKDTGNDSKVYVNNNIKKSFNDIPQNKEQEHIKVIQEPNNVIQSFENRKETQNSSKRNSKYIKVAPERVAVIEEKRKFNMKLRDIIEAGLNKLDESEHKNVADQTTETKNNLVGRVQVLPMDYEPKSKVDQCRLIGLEGRMKRMEDLLLYKIDQNNQKITEVQKMLMSNEKQRSTKSISTQTKWSDDAHKAYLFHEIAQYIDTELKSSLYEELFLSISHAKCNLTSDWYATVCLLEVIDELGKNNRKHHTILYYYNASSYTAKQINFEGEKHRTYEQFCIQSQSGNL